MSQVITSRIPDKKVVDDFKTLLKELYEDRVYVQGKELQKALKLLMAFYGYKDYRHDPEVEELWDTDPDDTHTYSNDVHAQTTFKSIDDFSLPKLSNKKERAYAVYTYLKNCYIDVFTYEDFGNASMDIVGSSDRRSWNDYLDILMRYELIFKIPMREITRKTINKQKFYLRDNDMFCKFDLVNIESKHEILKIAKEEANNLNG